MRTRWTVIALLVLGVLGATLFLHYFERVPVKERVPPKGEARLRDFLAAERFAERMGMRSRELRSLPELDYVRPGLLIMPNRRQGLDRNRIQRVLAWVHSGGHLVVEAEFVGVDDPLLDALGVTRSDGKPQERPDFLDRIALSAPFAAKLQVGEKLVSFPRGRGMVTAAASLHFARNHRIGQPGNAELLWRVMQLTPRNEFQVYFRPERLSLTGFLMQHAWAVLAAAAVLLALWLWRIAPRFGTVAPDLPPSRRRLLDHLRASGRYYWSQGLRARLVLAARDAALRRVARTQPDFANASANERQRRLASLMGAKPEEAAQFMATASALRGGDFIRLARHAQRIHSSLDKGGK